MLKTLRVTDFKIVRDSKLLTLQPLSVLIGRNGSGKSSIIEALDWLSRALIGGVEGATEEFHRITDVIHAHSDVDRFGLTLEMDPRDASVGDTITYRVEVGYNEQKNPEVRLEELSAQGREGSQYTIRTEPSTGNREFIKRSRFEAIRRALQDMKIRDEDRNQLLEMIGDMEETGESFTDQTRLALSASEQDEYEFRTGVILKDFLERAVFLRLSPKTIASFAPAKASSSPRLLDEAGQGLSELIGQLDDEKKALLVQKLTYIIQGASGIDNHTPQVPSDRRFFSLIESVAGGEPIEIPSWVLSEGTRRITAILALLLHPTPPRLLCIEEVENGLDPWTLGFLLEELTKAVRQGMQIILTTHSPYLLDLGYFPLESIILAERLDYGVEFYAGDRLPDLGVLQHKMGLGSLYTKGRLYRRAED